MKEWNGKLFFKWGELVGKTHTIAKDYQPNGFSHRGLDWYGGSGRRNRPSPKLPKFFAVEPSCPFTCVLCPLLRYAQSGTVHMFMALRHKFIWQLRNTYTLYAMFAPKARRQKHERHFAPKTKRIQNNVL